MDKFKNAKEVEEHLSLKGYIPNNYDYLGNSLLNILYVNKENRNKNPIIVDVSESEEYSKYIETIPEGTEFTTDLSRCECTGIFIHDDDIIYPEKEYERGIRIENSIKLLETTFLILEHKISWTEFIYTKHFDNIRKFKKEYWDYVLENGGKEMYNSIIDTNGKLSSNPRIGIGFNIYDCIILETDFLTGEMDLSNFKKDFDKEIENNKLYKKLIQSQ